VELHPIAPTSGQSVRATAKPECRPPGERAHCSPVKQANEHARGNDRVLRRMTRLHLACLEHKWLQVAVSLKIDVAIRSLFPDTEFGAVRKYFPNLRALFGQHKARSLVPLQTARRHAL